MHLRDAVLPQENPFRSEKRQTRRSRYVPDAQTSFANCRSRPLMMAGTDSFGVAKAVFGIGDLENGGQLAHAERRTAVEDLEEFVVEEHVEEHADGDVAEDQGERHCAGGWNRGLVSGRKRIFCVSL